ncbi:MAG: PIN domain-containing protein [Gemmatimonadetes bacterium]|nr:PIN domain-containing protein [Gemmatimonadota bacterium]NNK64808.1 PIN domain-containing protein [Gemmatimonadota bacterium]
MGILIDTSVLVEYERGRLDVDELVADRMTGRADEPFHLSVISVSELLHGVHRARDRAQRARRSAFVEGVIDAFPILPIDLLTARTHAELGAALAERGTPIGSHDLWIAAAAVGRGLALATFDVRGFGRVPGLAVDDWSS